MQETDRAIAVQVRNVSKNFGEGDAVVHALRDVNFEAFFGELLMIVGPSGCGKTTLLSIIAGTLKFDQGQVDVLNHSLHDMSDEDVTQFRRKNIGFIFQQFHLIKTLNVLENIAIPLILNGSPWPVALEKAEVILEKVGLKGRGHERPSNLSGGQQQRVAIARALVHDPLLLICDEPTSSLDADSGSHVLELMTEIAKSPERIVLVVTHDSRIFKYADRLARMDDGVITHVEQILNRGSSPEF